MSFSKRKQHTWAERHTHKPTSCVRSVSYAAQTTQYIYTYTYINIQRERESCTLFPFTKTLEVLRFVTYTVTEMSAK